MSAARQIYSSAPCFFVADCVKAAAYYSDVLGFAVPRLWGKPPTFCIASRDDFRIMLSQVKEATRIHPNGAYPDSLDAYFWVRDADALFTEFRGKGADIVFAPVDRPEYGQRELGVRDLDGYVLVFAHEISVS